MKGNKKLKLSLIITTYNRPNSLELTLQSAFNQSILPDEIIIADDGSGEETKKLIERYAAIAPAPLIHCWQEDKGFRLSKIRNIAIAKSVFDYIVMTDGDVVLERNFIRDHKRAAQIGFFVQGPKANLSKNTSQRLMKQKSYRINRVILFYDLIKNNRIVTTIHSSFLAWCIAKMACLKIPIVTDILNGPQDALKAILGCNMAFWKSDAIKVNGFNEEFLGWGREDNAFAALLINNGIKRRNLKFEGLAFHLFHEHACSKDMLSKNTSILEDTITNKRTRTDNGLGKYLLN